MRKLAVALFLAIAPLATAPLVAVPAIAATVSEPGDLSALSAIAADTLAIARTGDLTAAQKRVTDFESAWDQAAGAMQPLSPEKWHTVDMAADRAIEGLRTGAPVQADVEAALTGLIAALDNPGAGAGAAPVAAAAPAGTFAVINADGSPLPCEVALKTLRDAAASTKPTDQAAYDGAMNKGLERCNADDDKRADGFLRGQRRLDQISSTMADVGRGNLAARIALNRRNDDVDRIGRDVNTALDRLAALVVVSMQSSSPSRPRVAPTSRLPCLKGRFLAQSSHVTSPSTGAFHAIKVGDHRRY